MTCDDYLAMLETLPVDELMYGDARQHAAQCHDCNRVTRVVAERERNMILALGDARSSVAPSGIAREAVNLARRRRIAGYYRAALVVASVVAIAGIVATRRIVPSNGSEIIRDEINLQCLSPDQAVVILRGAGIRGAIRHANTPVAVIQIETTVGEHTRIVDLMDRYDNPKVSACAAQVVVPKLDGPRP